MTTKHDQSAAGNSAPSRSRFFGLSSDLFCIAGPDGFFKDLNPAWERSLGWSLDELYATSFLDFIHPDDIEATTAEVVRLGKGETLVDFENRYRHKDGSWHILSWNVSAEPDGTMYGVARDVTEARAVASSVVALKERYRALTEAASEGIVLSIDGRIIEANTAAARILGFAGPDDMVDVMIADLVAPENRAVVLARIRANDPGPYEMDAIRRDMRGIRIEARASHAEYDGKLVRVTGIRDVTERRRVETERNAIRQQADLILESVGEGIFGVDPDGNTTFMNAAGANLLGWAKEDLIGKPQHEISHHTRPDGTDYLRAECPIYNAMKDGAVHRITDDVFWRKDGTSFPVEYTSTPTVDAGGRIAGSVVTFRDVTEPRRAAAEARLLHDLTREIAESREFEPALSAVLARVCEATEWVVGEAWIPDRETGILRRGPFWVTHPTRYQPFIDAGAPLRFAKGEGMPGIAWQDRKAVWIEDVEDAPQFIRKAAAGESGLHAGFTIPVIASGRVEAVLAFFMQEARPTDERYVRLVQSLTTHLGTVIRQKSDESQLARRRVELERLNRDLERSNGELEQFAYVASHDLQEPLRMVASYMNLLKRRYGTSLDADAHEFIEFAVDGATRMQGLIDDLLSFSRIHSQSRPFSRTPIDEPLDVALSNLTIGIGDADAGIIREPLPELPADASQLAQLFQNLIGNAIKFARTDVKPEIRIGATELADAWEFTVADNGIGIDPKYRDRIFDIFQRLHGREEYHGTGIGLAICRRIVERHGGAIAVEGNEAGGSTFRFTLLKEPADPLATKGDDDGEGADDVADQAKA